MTVIVTKDAINLREKLSELDKETGIKGEELMRADTSAEAREALQLDQQLFTDFESTGIDDNATSTAVTIASSGNVGIGESNPAELLHLTATTPVFRMEGASKTYQQYVSGTSFFIRDVTAGFNRVTLDSSGNLLVGKTSTSISSTGIEAKADGQLWATRDGNPVLSLNRQTSDGSMAVFYKDGTTVGSIGARGGDVYLETGDTGIRMYDQSDAIIPVGSDGVSRDAAIDLGLAPNIRFKDLYLSGGAYLGGTAAANKLDDYEEGTWTAVYSPSVSSFGTITMTTFVGDAPSYVKIGRMVTVTAVMETYDLTIGAASGDVRIDGLPFTIDKSGAATISDTVGWAGQNPLSGSILGNDYITLQYRSLVDGDDTILNVTDLTTGSGMSNSNFLKFTLTYMTNA